MVHTATQLPYGLVVAGAAVAFGYLPAALWQCPWAASLLAGAALFWVMHRYWGVTASAPSPAAARSADSDICSGVDPADPPASSPDDPPGSLSFATESQAADTATESRAANTTASPTAAPSSSPTSASGTSACDSPPKKASPTEPPPASQH
jgi:hypothetical protein